MTPEPISCTAAPPREVDNVYTFAPLESSTAESVASWLALPEVHKWMDFGGGRQVLTRTALMMMHRSGSHAIRTVHDSRGELFGVIGLSHIDSPFRNAWVWALRDPARRRASMHLWLYDTLAYGFRTLGLKSIYSQAVEINQRSIVSVRRAGMKEVGRQRLSHIIDGRFYDRLLFDITDTELPASPSAKLD